MNYEAPAMNYDRTGDKVHPGEDPELEAACDALMAAIPDGYKFAGVVARDLPEELQGKGRVRMCVTSNVDDPLEVHYHLAKAAKAVEVQNPDRVGKVISPSQAQIDTLRRCARELAASHEGDALRDMILLAAMDLHKPDVDNRKTLAFAVLTLSGALMVHLEGCGCDDAAEDEPKPKPKTVTGTAGFTSPPASSGTAA